MGSRGFMRSRCDADHPTASRLPAIRWQRLVATLPSLDGAAGHSRLHGHSACAGGAGSCGTNSLTRETAREVGGPPPLSGPSQSPYDQGMEALIAAFGTFGLIVLGVAVLTILKATAEHVCAIVAPKLAVTGFVRVAGKLEGE